MKCEIAKDLLPMYAENLCSPETSKELEEHLAGCTKCAEKLQNYLSEMENERAEVEENNKRENESDLKPMKKIRRKLTVRKVVVIVLGIILVSVLGVVGYLSYGEITNKCMSFTIVKSVTELNKVTEELVNGNTQALIDIIEFDNDTKYFINTSDGFNDMNDYKDYLKEKMDEAHEHFFKGKEIEVKIIDIYQCAYDEVDDSTNIITSIDYGFFENGKKVLTIMFQQGVNGKYKVAELTSDTEYSFVSELALTNDNRLSLFLEKGIEKSYESYINGKKDITPAFYLVYLKESEMKMDDPLYETLNDLYDKGWYFRKSMYSIECFNRKDERWEITVWYYIENEKGDASCVLEQSVYYYDSKLLVNQDEVGNIICSEGEIPDDIYSKLITLFK